MQDFTIILLSLFIFQFRKLLNKELSHFAESSKSGVQVSKFLINTYMDKDDDEANDKELAAAAAAVVAGHGSDVSVFASF